MMRQALTVLRKEALENLRDRRTLFSAFLFVPLLGPLLFAVMTAFIVDRVVSEADERLHTPVIGVQHAPNLLAFLRENGANVVEYSGDLQSARQAVASGQEYFVLAIDERLGAQLRSGEPVMLLLVADSSNNKAQRYVAHVRALLAAYSSRIARQRLLARGMDPAIIEPIAVRTQEVATPSGRAVALLGAVTYFLLFSLLMGGLYLAIDVTAGERERGSLESLLCVPVGRAALAFGKIGATALFMIASLCVSLIVLSASMPFLPLYKLGMNANFTPLIAMKIAALLLPLALLGSALFFIVGSFTRSYREAQTWIGLALALPTLPILFASVANLRSSFALMFVPSLSQHLLATEWLRGDAVEPSYIAASAASTLAIGGGLVWLATRLYRREKVLG